jgi:hypothetical protein
LVLQKLAVDIPHLGKPFARIDTLLSISAPLFEGEWVSEKLQTLDEFLGGIMKPVALYAAG